MPLVNFFRIDGHVTDHAEDLQTAEEHISVSKFDIVLLDIMLPDGDGRDFLKKIRKKNNNVPVIVMTAKTEISDKVDLLDIGADDYIIKPFDTGFAFEKFPGLEQILLLNIFYLLQDFQRLFLQDLLQSHLLILLY